VLGVTTTVDDEKPLWAELDPNERIRSLGDARRARHVTAGVYFLQPLVYSLANEALPHALTAFRAVLGALLERGHPLYGFDVGPCIDVDRPETSSRPSRCSACVDAELRALGAEYSRAASMTAAILEHAQALAAGRDDDPRRRRPARASSRPRSCHVPIPALAALDRAAVTIR
jgi:hypothetical protein